MTAVEWLYDKWSNCTEWKWEEIKQWFEKAKEMEKWQRMKFEIPELSDEEIKEWIDSTPYYGHCTTEYKEGLDDGIKWYREQLKQRQ